MGDGDLRVALVGSLALRQNACRRSPTGRRDQSERETLSAGEERHCGPAINKNSGPEILTDSRWWG